MNEEKKIISFGLEEELRGVYGTGSIGSVYAINSREHILTTTRNLYKIEKSQIKKCLPYQFLVTCYIPEYQLVVGYSSHGSELFVLEDRDLEHPVTAHFQTEHNGVFHILYSERSSIIVLVGSGVSVWEINVTIPDTFVSGAKPIVEIKLRSRFAQEYETVIMNSPCFDYQRELLFLATQDGVCAFNMDGEVVRHVTRAVVGSNSVFGYSQKLRRVMTVDQDSVISLWDFDGYNCGTFSISASAFFSVQFLDEEHVLLMNAKGIMFILNLKTRKSFHVYTAEKLPNRLIVQREPELTVILTFQSAALFLKVTLPWKMWTENIIMPKSIRRVPKLHEAARVIVHTNDSFIRMLSPVTKKIITVATTKSLALPSYVAYDRGCLVYYVKKQQKGDFPFGAEREATEQIECLNVDLPTSQFDCEIIPGCKRDELFMIMTNGFLCRFDTGSDPCKELMAQDLKAGVVTAFFDQKGGWGYAVCSPRGEAFLCDYNNLKVLKRFRVTPYAVEACNVFFSPMFGVIVFLYLSGAYVYNVNTGLITQNMPLQASRQSHMFGNYIFIGHDNGTIDILELQDGMLVAVSMSSDQQIHSEGVSGMAFSPSFWISASLDGSVVLWDYNFMILGRIVLPEPIYACEILNGKKDIVVGTNSEIMIISGAEVFGEDCAEDENELLDNFDGKVDVLVKDEYVPFAKQEDDDLKLIKMAKAKATKALNATGKRGKLRDLLKQQRERFKFDRDALEVLNRLNEEGDFNADKERLNALREMQQMGQENQTKPTVIQGHELLDSAAKEEGANDGERGSTTSKRKKKRRATSGGDGQDESDTDEQTAADLGASPEGDGGNGAEERDDNDDGDESGYSDDSDDNIGEEDHSNNIDGDKGEDELDQQNRKRRGHGDDEEYEYFEDENGQRKRRRKQKGADSNDEYEYEYYEDENGQRKRRRKNKYTDDDDDEYYEDENGQRKRRRKHKGASDDDDEDYEDEDGARRRRQKNRRKDSDADYEYYEDENGQRKRRRKKDKTNGESDNGALGASNKKKGHDKGNASASLKNPRVKNRAREEGEHDPAGEGKAGNKKGKGYGNGDDALTTKKKKLRDDDEAKAKGKAKKEENIQLDTEKVKKQKKAKKSKKKTWKQSSQNITEGSSADKPDLADADQSSKRPSTPPSIRPRRIGSEILRRLAQGKYSRSRLEKRKRLLGGTAYPAVILDQETLLKNFVRGQTELLPLLRAIKKSTVNARQFQNQQDGSIFSKTMGVHSPPGPRNPRHRQFNFTTGAIPRAAIINMPETSTSEEVEHKPHEPSDEVQEIMDEAMDWQRIPITARVVAYNNFRRGGSQIDLLASAVLEKMPEMRSCATFKPKKTESNKLYRNPMRPKVVQPLGKLEHSITVRHSMNGRIFSMRAQRPLDDLKPADE